MKKKETLAYVNMKFLLNKRDKNVIYFDDLLYKNNKDKYEIIDFVKCKKYAPKLAEAIEKRALIEKLKEMGVDVKSEDAPLRYFKMMYKKYLNKDNTVTQKDKRRKATAKNKKKE